MAAAKAECDALGEFNRVIHMFFKELIPYVLDSLKNSNVIVSAMADPILDQNSARFTSFPIRYPDLWALYKKAVASFWTVEEIDFAAGGEGGSGHGG